MIDRAALLKDATRLLRTLEADLIARSESMPEVREVLHRDYEAAQKARRTAQNYEDWRSDYATQQAVAWVLSAVFVRFLEDNALIAPPQLAGPGEALQRARDQHELYFREHPTETDREYLLHVFHTVGKLPGAREVFGKHNPVFELPHWLSGDAAGALLQFFQRIDADTGALVHDFADPEWNTRFLGDLYQDLSEATRKKYALLQTPEFIEEFILDRTLDPALDEFGLNPPPARDTNGDDITGPGFRMIDPACGSGHFLLGAFVRILDRWQRKEPGTPVRDLVQRTLDSVCGVDLNPYAIAIARFRLLLVALRACDVKTLRDAPAFNFNLAAGDSLLHGSGYSTFQLSTKDLELRHGAHPLPAQEVMEFDSAAHFYFGEDSQLLDKLLKRGAYHAVVANPPYIAIKDSALRDRYRKRFLSCHGRFVLTVPFMERLFNLATRGGVVGQITSNSFMKREFGKKLIEVFFPTVDLTHVVDASGAYIPGHGTPTVILFGRTRPPVSSTIRTVLGIRGEPQTPLNPAKGLVWSAICNQIDNPGSSSAYVSVNDSERRLFVQHPWAIGGGGAAELKEEIELSNDGRLVAIAEAIGITAVTGEDELFMQPTSTFSRRQIEYQIDLVEGDIIRDWNLGACSSSIWLYDIEFGVLDLTSLENSFRLIWTCRAAICHRRRFGTPMVERGLKWYEWQELYVEKLRTPLSITYAEVATHNHFVLDRGGKVFKQTAPVIKLPAGATEDAHLALLGLLNSSAACFWMKQGAHNKGDSTDQHGARTTGDEAFNTFAFNATLIGKMPLAAGRPLRLAQQLDTLAQSLQSHSFPSALARWATDGYADLRFHLKSAQEAAYDIRLRMVALQEELDWQCYRLYGLVEGDALEWPESELDALPPVHLGERAFEIVLARKMAAGKEDTTWFARHGSTPITEIPSHWPKAYRALVQRRIDCIESNANIALIERPEYTRRWNWEDWESQHERALRTWLLDRLESYFDFDGRMNDAGTPTAQVPAGTVCSMGHLADFARADTAFHAVAEVYTGDLAFDVLKLVSTLVEAESVPLLHVLRYKESGLRKRAEWEKTWALQREEDALEDERTRATAAMKREEARIRATLQDQWQTLTKKRRQLLELCRQAPEFADVEKGSSAQPETLAGVLLSNGLSNAGLGLSISTMLENIRPDVSAAEKALWKACEADPAWQEANRWRYERIPENPKIPVPPKYTSADFVAGPAWRLRGKLDVPKERWISLPHCEGADGTLMLLWAGNNHLQQAQALSAHYVDIQERLGGRDDARLLPLLLGLIELIPWLKQWHNDIDPEHQIRLGDYYESFTQDECRNLGKTLEEIRQWTPPAKGRGRKARSE